MRDIMQSGFPKRSSSVDITFAGDVALINNALTASFADPLKHLRSLHKFSLSVKLHTNVDSSYACLNWSHSIGSPSNSGKSFGVDIRLSRLALDVLTVALVRFFIATASISTVLLDVLYVGGTWPRDVDAWAAIFSLTTGAGGASHSWPGVLP